MDEDEFDALDRHALAWTIWLAAGVIVAPLYHFGATGGGAGFILAGFAVATAAFAGHVIVNFVLGRDFSRQELALGLVVYAVALVGFGLETLVSPPFAARAFWPTSLGFVALLGVFLFYLVTKGGVRTAFDAFDAIRSFRARPETRR